MEDKLTVLIEQVKKTLEGATNITPTKAVNIPATKKINTISETQQDQLARTRIRLFNLPPPPKHPTHQAHGGRFQSLNRPWKK